MKNGDIKVLASNKKARHDYHILSKYEAGIVLQGSEVKAIREGNINLKDSYGILKDGEVFLVSVHIGPYKPANKLNHEPERRRKLLLHKGEIKKLIGKLKDKGITLVPLQVYLKNGFIKVEVATVKGKRSYDKREAIKERDYNREREREWKAR